MHIIRLLLLLAYKSHPREAFSPQGEVDATGCSPAGCGQRYEPGRSPDRELLSEVKAFLKLELASLRFLFVASVHHKQFDFSCESIFERLESLDKGEAATASQDATE